MQNLSSVLRHVHQPMTADCPHLPVNQYNTRGSIRRSKILYFVNQPRGSRFPPMRTFRSLKIVSDPNCEALLGFTIIGFLFGFFYLIKSGTITELNKSRIGVGLFFRILVPVP